MENPGLEECVGAAVRKRRTRTSRFPKRDQFPLSGDVGKVSGDYEDDANPRRKEVNVNQFVNRVYSGSRTDGAKIRVKNKEVAGEFKELNNIDPGQSALSTRCSEGVLAPAIRKCSSNVDLMDGDLRDDNVYGGRNGECQSLEHSRGISDALGSEGKVRKVKLKIGGVTRTIQANYDTDGASSLKMSHCSDSSKSDKSQEIQDNLAEVHLASGKRPDLQGIPWKTSRGGFNFGIQDSLMGRASGKSAMKQVNQLEPVRKSKRAPKKPALDEDFGEDYEDDVTRYLEKLKAPRTMFEGYNEDDGESKQKHRKLSSVAKVGALRLKDGKKKANAVDEEDGNQELGSDLDTETSKTKKLKKDSVDALLDVKGEITLTTRRQRALQSSKDGSSASGANLIEFPDGLPPAPSRKQKEKLTETEQQIKKAEAAERRRLQNEKAARESEAEAIRKILGQDSSRKKKEDKIKKRHQELAQEKAANALNPGSNTVRWVTGPTGTVLTFPTDTDLPSIFNSKPASYPPPREKCAGPSCSNPYRYWDSKSKLPLCSLVCYKAVQGQTQTETSC